MNWILIVPFVGIGLVALIGWVMAWSYLRHFQNVAALYDAACAERKLLYAKITDLRRTLEEEHKDVYAQNADLREALQERIAEVKNLQAELRKAHATETLEIQEAGNESGY